MDFYLLDGRAGFLATTNDGVLDTDDNGKYIVVVGSLKECCVDANNGTYGDNCVVSDKEFNILWELVNKQGHWIAKNYKKG